MTDTTFKREQRYIVFKLTDLQKHIEPSDLFNLQQIGRTVGAGREQDGKSPLECLVVESDWPEYEPTWRAIEQRVSGAALTQPAQSALEPMSREQITKLYEVPQLAGSEFENGTERAIALIRAYEEARGITTQGKGGAA